MAGGGQLECPERSSFGLHSSLFRKPTSKPQGPSCLFRSKPLPQVPPGVLTPPRLGSDLLLPSCQKLDFHPQLQSDGRSPFLLTSLPWLGKRVSPSCPRWDAPKVAPFTPHGYHQHPEVVAFNPLPLGWAPTIYSCWPPINGWPRSSSLCLKLRLPPHLSVCSWSSLMRKEWGCVYTHPGNTSTASLLK